MNHLYNSLVTDTRINKKICQEDQISQIKTLMREASSKGVNYVSIDLKDLWHLSPELLEEEFPKPFNTRAFLGAVIISW